jgi:hypothetical protein
LDSHKRVLANTELADDLSTFFEKGAGFNSSYGLACVLLEDIFGNIDRAMASAANDTLSATFGELRFSHAETLLPLLSLLQLYPAAPLPTAADYSDGGRNVRGRRASWAGSSSVMAPFGASLLIVLHACGDGVATDDSGDAALATPTSWLLTVVHNERVVRFPACPDSDACDVTTVQRYYRDVVYRDLGLASCSRSDWQRWCEGLVPCSSGDRL